MQQTKIYVTLYIHNTKEEKLKQKQELPQATNHR